MSDSELVPLDGDITPMMKPWDMKAVVDALALGHPDMDFAVALNANTVIPMQAVVADKDRKFLVFTTRDVAKQLQATGNANTVFTKFSDQEKRDMLGE